jgi:hypothetical protein
MAIPAIFAMRFTIRGNLRRRLRPAGGTSVVVMQAIIRDET